MCYGLEKQYRSCEIIPFFESHLWTRAYTLGKSQFSKIKVYAKNRKLYPNIFKKANMLELNLFFLE